MRFGNPYDISDMNEELGRLPEEEQQAPYMDEATNRMVYPNYATRNPVDQFMPEFLKAKQQVQKEELDPLTASAMSPEEAETQRAEQLKSLSAKYKSLSQTKNPQDSGVKADGAEATANLQDSTLPEKFELKDRKPDYDMEAALAQAQMGLASESILKGANLVSAGLIGHGVQANPEVFNGVSELAKSGLKRVDALRKEEELNRTYRDQQMQERRFGMENTKFENEQAYEATLKDPNSQETQIARQLAQEYGVNLDLSKATAYDIQKKLPFLQEIFKTKSMKEDKALQRQMQLMQMQQGNAYKQAQLELAKSEADRRQLGAYNQLAKELEGNDQFKKLKTQEMAFQDVDALLSRAKNGNQAAIGALGTRLAKAMGEVGPLTDQDSTRYMGNVSYYRKFQSWWNKGAEGDLPKGQIEDIKAVVDLFKEKQASQINQVINRYANRGMSIYGLDQEKALKYLSAPGYTQQPLPTNQGQGGQQAPAPQQAPASFDAKTKAKIANFMKANGIANEAEAIKILKQAGKL